MLYTYDKLDGVPDITSAAPSSMSQLKRAHLERMRFQNAHLRVYDACSMTTPARTHVLTYIHMQPPGFALKLSPEVTRWRCESLWVPYRSLQVTAPPHASCIKTQVSTCTRHGVRYRSYLLRQVPRSTSTSRTEHDPHPGASAICGTVCTVS